MVYIILKIKYKYSIIFYRTPTWPVHSWFQFGHLVLIHLLPQKYSSYHYVHKFFISNFGIFPHVTKVMSETSISFILMHRVFVLIFFPQNSLPCPIYEKHSQRKERKTFSFISFIEKNNLPLKKRFIVVCNILYFDLNLNFIWT